MNAGRSKGNAVPDGLVPLHTDYGATAPFIYATLSGLNMLSDERTVEQYIQANPDAHRAIFALSREVAKAGVRARDGNRKGNVFDEKLKQFSAEEIWMFDLAIDVLAMLATSGGMRNDTHLMVLDKLRSIDKDKHVHGLHWKAQVHKAGDGPTEFRELRAHVPRHKALG